MTETGASADGGLAGRITKPEPTETSHTSWADEVNSPSETDAPTSIDDKMSKLSTEPTEKKEAPVSQLDGAAEPFGGSELHEPDYDVEVKLADMQADPNNPLYSATTFEELGLYDKAFQYLSELR